MSKCPPGKGETGNASASNDKELPDRIYREEDWLRARYWGDMMTALEIADLVDRNEQTILNQLRKNGVEVRKHGHTRDGVVYSNATEKISDRDWLEGKYWGEGMSTLEIAEMVGVTEPAVWQKMVRFDIPRRSYKEAAPRGKDHPNWLGGVDDYYGPKWNDISESIRERDGYECQICSKSRTDLENGRELDVHHITPYRMFDDDEKAHDEDNLITLCRSCHRKWERIPLKPIVS